jgi:tetratricopeptide (TPR) repeat protein
MKRKLIYATLCLLLCGGAYAQKKTVVSEYTYRASEVDSKVTARAFAITEMKKILLREIGEYLKAERKSISGVYSEKIEAITAGIVKMKTLNERWDGNSYYIQAEMTVDPAEVNKEIAAILNDTQKTKELEEERNRRKAAEANLAKLKRELEQAKNQHGGSAINQSAQKAYIQKAYELTDKEKGDKAYGNQFYALAVENYENAIKKNTNDAEVYFKMGVAYYKQKEYHTAREHLEKATELNPNSAEAYYYLGLVYSEIFFDMSVALLAFQKALTIKPNYAEAYVGMGVVYLKDRDYIQAMEAFKKAISINPSCADAYYHMYEAQSSAHDFSQAKEYLRTACRLGSLEAQKEWNTFYRHSNGNW